MLKLIPQRRGNLMAILKTAVWLSFGFLLLVGCNQEAQDISEKVHGLENDLQALKFRVDVLESGEASVTTEEEVYGIAKTKFGTFTVLARNVTPYLDGFKVKLRIGNLASANFNGAKISVAWGPSYDNKNPGEYYKNRKEKKFDVTDEFSSGSYTDVEVALTPAKPEEVKRLLVGIELNQLSLQVPFRTRK